jgi:hypothetical protein
VLPKGQHRIRHYGLFANGGRAANITRIRELLAARASIRGRWRAGLSAHGILIGINHSSAQTPAASPRQRRIAVALAVLVGVS